ncbi:hypothetical protein A4X13_0g6190 [Tilletia indica]|uniref:Uncharacterized protein n=1 Tax=Tilletia indica TaxID=43049 RepID=A0A177TIN6_9BASI|nr:hypothetical protein A4X13_0g6190 [Tilletia indica]
MSDTSMEVDLALAPANDQEEQDEDDVLESDSEDDDLSTGSSESDQAQAQDAIFKELDAEKSKRRADTFGGEQDENEADSEDSETYYNMFANEEDLGWEFIDPVPEWLNVKYRKVRSPLFVKVYNDVAALTPRVSDVIRAGLEDIRIIIRSLRRLKAFRSRVEAFCILALRFWKLIATHEAATGNRNQAGTSLNFFLTESLRQVFDFISVVRGERLSTVVRRSRYIEKNQAGISQATVRLKQLIAAGRSLLDLRSDTILSADGTAPFFANIEVHRNFRQQLNFAILRFERNPPLTTFLDVSYLLEMGHLLRNIDFSHDSDECAWANEGDEVGSTGVSRKQLTDALDSLVPRVQAQINEPVLEPLSGPVELGWKLNTADSIRIGYVQKIFDSPKLHQLLYAMFASFIHVGLCDEASVIGEFLVIRLRSLVGEQEHGPGHRRQRYRNLCSALAALSGVLIEAKRPLDAMYAADEAVKIFEQVLKGSDQNLDGSTLHARLVFQQFRAYHHTEDYYLELTGHEKLTSSIELFRVALANGPSNTDGRIALAFAVYTYAMNVHSKKDLVAIREEAIALYRQLNAEKPEIMLFGEHLADLLDEHAIRESQNKGADAKYFEFFKEAVERYDDLAKKHPMYRQPLIRTCHNYADRLHEANQDRLALELLDKGISIHDEPDYEPTHAELGGVGGIHHMLLQRAAVCIKLEMYESGLVSAARAEDLIVRRVGVGCHYLFILKDVRQHKATCQRMLGQAEVSAANFNKTVEAETLEAARSLEGEGERNC